MYFAVLVRRTGCCPVDPTPHPVFGKTGRVYEGSVDGMLYCFSAGTGNVLWAARMGTEFESVQPIEEGARGVLVERDPTLMMVGARGQIEWRISMPRDIMTVAWDRQPGSSIYVGSYDGRIVAIDVSGRIIWRGRAEARALNGYLSTRGIYVGKQMLQGFTADLERKWIYAFPSPIQSFVLDDAHGLAYVSTNDGTLYCIRAAALRLEFRGD